MTRTVCDGDCCVCSWRAGAEASNTVTDDTRQAVGVTVPARCRLHAARLPQTHTDVLNLSTPLTD